MFALQSCSWSLKTCHLFNLELQVPASRSCFFLRPVHPHVLCTSRGPPLNRSLPLVFLSRALGRACGVSAPLAPLQPAGRHAPFCLRSLRQRCPDGTPGPRRSSRDKSCLSSQDVPLRPSLMKLRRWASSFLLRSYLCDTFSKMSFTCVPGNDLSPFTRLWTVEGELVMHFGSVNK